MIKRLGDSLGGRVVPAPTGTLCSVSYVRNGMWNGAKLGELVTLSFQLPRLAATWSRCVVPLPAAQASCHMEQMCSTPSSCPG